MNSINVKPLDSRNSCTTGEPSPKTLEDGTIPLDQFHSKDGSFQYAQLPIGITGEEAAKRLGVEDLGTPVAQDGDVANWDTHLGSDLTRIYLAFNHWEQEDNSTVANLHLTVGKAVYANETD